MIRAARAGVPERYQRPSNATTAWPLGDRKGAVVVQDQGNMSNVIELAAYRPRTAPGAPVVEAAWHAARAGMLVPLRARLDPAALGPALPACCVIERIGPGLARFRVAGSTLTRIAGFELRNMPFSAIWQSAARHRIGSAIEALFEEPAEIEIGLEDGPGRMRLWPLRDADGRISLALGHLELRHPPGAGPIRLTPGHLARRMLIGAEEPIADAPPRGGTKPRLSLVTE